MSTEKIVIVEDEPDILEVISYNLRREGFQVYAAFNGTIGEAIINKELPDLVILDLMLPGKNGLEICRNIKKNPETENILVIMLTAKGEEKDIVLGLNAGADDYIIKPFSPKELIARVRAVLRRGLFVGRVKRNKPIKIGELSIDENKHKIMVENREIKFTATEFRLIHYLALNSGRVFSREQLLNNALGDKTVVVDRNIDVHIRGIRKKMDIFPPLIETIRGIGYRFKDSEKEV